MRIAPLILVLAGCVGDEKVFEACDDDGDGYVEANCGGLAVDEPDCAEGDASVHPRAAEICDAKDNDCDDAIDEQPSDGIVYYRDADGDGAGAPSDTTMACEPPVGFVSTGGDCDDADQDASPDVPEQCDGIDNDCDELIDEAGEQVPWFLDGDGDGYGSDASVELACGAPAADWTLSGGDCADADDAVHPGATETWYDGVDQDCSGGSDFDQDSDGFATDDVEADCDDEVAAVNPGATEVCEDGIDNDCVPDDCAWVGEHALADQQRITGLNDGDRFGAAVAVVGDYDGDGVADVVVGAPGSDAKSVEGGSVYLLRGPIEDVADLSGAARFEGAIAGAGAGASVGAVGDFNGDGLDDVAWGAPDTDEGYAYVDFGANTMGATLAPEVRLRQTDPEGGTFGYAVASAGDVDGDGKADLLVGDHFYQVQSDKYSFPGGRAYLFSGGTSGDLTDSDAEAVFTTATALSLLGTDVGPAGDIDGDGNDDLFVSSGGQLEAYFWLGPVSGVMSREDADVTAIGGTVGLVVAAVGDTNVDGYADLAFGTPHNSSGSANGGAVFVFEGDISGDIDLAFADGRVLAEAAEDHLGWRIWAAGDVDGDETSDIGIGIPDKDGAAVSSGASLIAYGPVVGSRVASAAGPMFGGDVAAGRAGLSGAAGLLDGGGYADVVIGRPDTGPGDIFVVFGTGL